MKRKDFKPGMRVIRINNDYGGMIVGQEDIVVGTNCDGITLKKFGDGHSSYSLKILKPNSLRQFMERGN